MTEGQIWQEVLNQADGDRSAALAELCRHDPDLLRRLQEKLRQQTQAEQYLTDVDLEPVPPRDSFHRDVLPQNILEPLERAGLAVQRLIARGGMGAVYQAIDRRWNRFVAVKILRPDRVDDTRARERFLREAHTTAMIQHPNVIAILHIAAEETLPYFVMPYIAGPSLQEILDRSGPLPVAEVVRLGREIASGLAAAHAQGVLHRDIKPANILLEGPELRAVLTDFGLAYDGDDLRLTTPGMVAGTPLYMSPEQAHGQDLDFRSDLFSLGVVLYALCTGHPPFRGNSAMAVLRQICDEQPPSISAINPAIPSRLSAIISRLMEKNPGQRFSSAGEVADLLTDPFESDITATTTVGLAPRYQPSGARPPRKGRGKHAASLTALLFLFCVTLAAQMFSTPPLPDPLSDSRRTAPPPGLTWEQIPQHMRDRLDKTEHAGALVVGIQGDAVRRPFALFSAAAYRPDGAVVALGSKDGKLRFVEARSGGEQRSPLTAHEGEITVIAFSGHGKYLATGGQDNRVILWNGADHQQVARVATRGKIIALYFSEAGERLYALLSTGAAQAEMQSWEASSGQEGEPVALSVGTPRTVALSPDHKRIAVGGNDGSIRLLDATTFKVQVVLQHHDAAVTALAFSADGRRLYSGSLDRTLRTWDPQGGAALAQLSTPDAVTSLALLPSGQRGSTLAAACFDGHLLICQPDAGRGLRQLREPGERLAFVLGSPDGQTFLVGGQFGTLSFVDARTDQDRHPFLGHRGAIQALAFDPQEKYLWSTGVDRTLAVWDLSTNRLASVREGLSARINALDFSPDGKYLAGGCQDRQIRVWEATQPPRQVAQWKCTGDIGVRLVRFHPEGSSLVTGDDRGGIQIWTRQGKLLMSWDAAGNPIRSLAYAGNGTQLLTAAHDTGLRRWDVRTSDELPRIPQNDQYRLGAVQPGESKYLVALNPAGQMVAWRNEAHNSGPHLLSEEGNLTHLTFLPGWPIVLGHSTERGTLLLADLSRNPPTVQKYRAPFLLGDMPRALAVSPSGRLLALGRGDGLVLILRLAQTGEEPRLPPSPQ